MSDPKKNSVPERPETVPGVDDRANEAFLDTIFDTDGKPNRDAQPVVEIEGDEDDDDERR